MPRKLLSRPELKKIFKRHILPHFLSAGVFSKNPGALIFGGQPGAGKSNLIRIIKKIKTDFLVINGDDLRGYHPRMLDLMDKDEINAPDLIQADCNYWVERLIKVLAEKKFSMIIEGTMRKPAVVEATCAFLKKQGYKIETVILTVPQPVSLASIFYRYEIQKGLVNKARFTKIENHYRSFLGLQKTVDEIFRLKMADRITLYSRRGTDYYILHENNLLDGEWDEKINPLRIFIKFAKRKLLKSELLYAASLWKKTLNLALQRKAKKNYIRTLKNHLKLLTRSRIMHCLF